MGFIMRLDTGDGDSFDDSELIKAGRDPCLIYYIDYKAGTYRDESLDYGGIPEGEENYRSIRRTSFPGIRYFRRDAISGLDVLEEPKLFILDHPTLNQEHFCGDLQFLVGKNIRTLQVRDGDNLNGGVFPVSLEQDEKYKNIFYLNINSIFDDEELKKCLEWDIRKE